MTGWDDLARELDAWGAAGRTATYWWRDDDATRPGPALQRLLRCAGEGPLALAVIPAAVEPELAEALAEAPASVLQHGFAHRNHAPDGAKKCELARDRPLEAVLAELAAGQARLAELFGRRFLPVLVPPWNRIDAGVVGRLAGIGFLGLSTYRPRQRQKLGALAIVNTHVDLVDWRQRRFVGTEAALGLLLRHLLERRAGAVDAEEPTGILTHHLVHDEAAWDFLGRLNERLRPHPAARWLSAESAFRLASPDADRLWKER